MQPRGNTFFNTRQTKITSARLSEDLKNFMSLGGNIEKLGNTPLRWTASPAKPAKPDRKE